MWLWKCFMEKEKASNTLSKLKNTCCGVRWETYRKITLGCYTKWPWSLPISGSTTAATNNSKGSLVLVHLSPQSQSAGWQDLANNLCWLNQEGAEYLYWCWQEVRKWAAAGKLQSPEACGILDLRSSFLQHMSVDSNRCQLIRAPLTVGWDDQPTEMYLYIHQHMCVWENVDIY